MSDSHADAVRRTVTALRTLGRLEECDVALVNAWELLAVELDDSDTKDRAALYREFRAYDSKVREVTGSDDVDDSLTELLARISGASGSDSPPS